MLKAFNTNRSIFVIILLALLLGAISFWAYLHDFYFVFLIPVIVAILLLGIVKTEKFILLTGALAPLSVNINDIGAGLGLALPTEPLIMFLFAMLAFRFLQRGRIDMDLVKHPLTLSILGYLAWLWISILFSSMPMVSFKFVLARTWYIVVFYLACAGISRNFNNIHFFIKALTVFTLALVVYTLSKHAADNFVRSSSYSISWPFFPDHGMYAAAIAFVAPALAFYAFNGRAFRFEYHWLPVAALFLIVLLFGIVVSYTRATWLSLVVAMGVYFLLKFRIRFSWILLSIFIVSIVGIVKQEQILYSLEANKQGSSDELEGHVRSVGNISTDPSNMERINRWKCAARMVAERPVFGFGPGTYSFQYGVYQRTNELTLISTNTGDLGDAHSEFFSALSETGFPGFFLWLGIVLVSVATAFKIIYKSQSRPVRITAMIAILGLITYFAHALLNNYSQYDKIAVPLWGFLAIIAALDLHFLKKEKPAKTHEATV